jgi:hypothetical protein
MDHESHKLILSQFLRAVQAGVASVMCSYSESKLPRIYSLLTILCVQTKVKQSQSSDILDSDLIPSLSQRHLRLPEQQDHQRG